MGIQRGIQNSRATHQQVSRYYTLTQGAAVTLPAPERYTAPELPNKLARMSDERLAAFSRDAARSGVNAQREAAEPIIAALQSENTRLKQQAEQVIRPGDVAPGFELLDTQNGVSWHYFSFPTGCLSLPVTPE